MVTEDPVDLNLIMSPSSRKIPAFLTKNSAQPCQTDSYGEIMWIRVRPTDDNDDDLLNDLTSKYRHLKFVNSSISSLRIFGQSCDSFIQICSSLAIDKAHTNYIITKL